MSRKTLIVLLILSIGINLGLLGFMAYDAVREARWFSERPPLPHWLGSIEGLTPEQIEQMHTIMAQGKEPIGKLRDELSRKRYELGTLISQPNPDPAAIDAKIAEISGIQVQMERLIVQQIIAIRQVLTPEQQQKLSEYMSQHMMAPGGPGPGTGGWRHGGAMRHRWGW